VTEERRVSVCRAFLTFRPEVDTEPRGRVQVYDGSGGRLTEEGVVIRDGVMEPVVRETDLQRALDQLDELLRDAGTWWRTRSFEEFEPTRQRDDRPLTTEERWALAFEAFMVSSHPAAWAAWEERFGVMQDRDGLGHFRRRSRDELARRSLIAARAVRQEAAVQMARWLGDEW
jgi:hypothetical protein